MAKLIPSLNSCLGRMQAGEKCFARLLESHLEDDYLCWYEVPVGIRLRYSDFIVLHPGRGLLLLEVKDWRFDSIRSADRVSFTLMTNSGVKSVSNPLEQVRQCAYQLMNSLEKDSLLVQQSGRYKGKLMFPYGYGVVLSNIKREQFVDSGLNDIIPEHLVICKDEMTASIDPEIFQKHLWDMFNYTFTEKMSLPQIDRIRWHLFPEVRINDSQTTMFDDKIGSKKTEGVIPDLIKVMDMQQEQLARSMGDGHRVVHGVAGSGKTMILGFRCLHLAKALNKPILVLCFNITLAAKLRLMMTEHNVNDRVHVYHFHDWCSEQLRLFNIVKPANREEYFDHIVQSVIEAVDKGDIPKGQYGALMIDEGHDFHEEWLRLVVQMVDPETNSILLLYDDAQSIYKKGSELNFTLSSVGIQARGRTTILKLNYRNTDEIIKFAYKFAKRYIAPMVSDEDHIPVIEPHSAGRQGPSPYVKLLNSFDEEAVYISDTIVRLFKDGMRWSAMCVIYRFNWMGEILNKVLIEADVPVQWLCDSNSKKAFNPNDNSVKLMTIHSSKGLEFSLVAIAGANYLPSTKQDISSEARLFYVAMTRSMEKLLITCHRPQGFAELLLKY